MDYDQEDKTWGTEKRGEDVIPEVILPPQRKSDWLSYPGSKAGNSINDTLPRFMGANPSAISRT